MAGRALNDEQVLEEMKKMTAFIKQEAYEKAREIKVKADEEHNIEKSKLVRQETLAIDAFFQKKIKQAQVQRKIAQSNAINKARLKVLQAREELLADLYADTQKQLAKVSENVDTYRDLMKGLLIQGLYQILEKDVTVVCRKQDVSIVEAIAAEAASNFEQAFKTTVKIQVDKSNFLNEKSAGGVILKAFHGRIVCNNTLEHRLELTSHTMLPAIRAMLFGISPARHFFD